MRYKRGEGWVYGPEYTYIDRDGNNVILEIRKPEIGEYYTYTYDDLKNAESFVKNLMEGRYRVLDYILCSTHTHFTANIYVVARPYDAL